MLLRHCGHDPQSPENKEILKQVQDDVVASFHSGHDSRYAICLIFHIAYLRHAFFDQIIFFYPYLIPNGIFQYFILDMTLPAYLACVIVSLTGTPHNETGIRQKLEQIPISDYLVNVATDELAKVLAGIN